MIDLAIGDFVSWDSSGGRARGKVKSITKNGTVKVPGTDFELNATDDDPVALITVFDKVEGGWQASDVVVGHKFSTLTKIDALPQPSEARAVNLEPPAYMRAAAKRGVQLHEEGLSGDGVVPQTVEDARKMSAGTVTEDKWRRIGRAVIWYGSMFVGSARCSLRVNKSLNAMSSPYLHNTRRWRASCSPCCTV